MSNPQNLFQTNFMFQKKVVPTVPKKELFIVFPYLGTLSSNLKQKLKSCSKNSLPQCNIKIILKLKNRLSSLFCFKDIIPKELQSHSVYKFLCGNCNVTYYGISHLTRKRVKCKPSAVSDHLLLHNNDSDFNDFTMLCPDNNGFRLFLKESVLISWDFPLLNKNTASVPLLLFD